MSAVDSPDIEFALPLADSRNYPPADFSMLARTQTPPLGGASRPAMENANAVLPMAWARNALALIGAHALPPGARVLLPAYHCPALVEPFIWAGSEVVFYPMNEQLDPQEAFLEAQLPAADAIVLVPFFGLQRDTFRFADMARQHNCLVIEDMAHAALKPILHGDLAVTSLQKFYPVSVGAELIIGQSFNGEDLEKAWRSTMDPQWRWQLRELWHRFANKLSLGSNCYRYLEPGNIGQPSPERDQLALEQLNHDEVVLQRRSNYAQLHDYLSRSAAGAPLFRSLELTDVPYVYPFLLRDASSFDAIRRQGIPLYRWEELADSNCQVSADYRARLVQMPCHQDLSREDVKKLIVKLGNAGL